MPPSRATIAVVLLAALCACEAPPQSPLDLVGAPAFEAETFTVKGESLRVALPAHCRRDRVEGFGLLPPGCASALLLTREVAERDDLLSPRRAGPGHAAPLERAARRYIFEEAP